MKMNFFKKVMTFFSIIWNAILWRRTVKDKKSKSVDKGPTEKNVLCEAERFETEEEARKAFVDVPLVAPGVDVNPFEVDSKINLHDPNIFQGVSEQSSPFIARNFAGIATNLLLADPEQAEQDLQSDLNACFEHNELLNDNPLPVTEGTLLAEIDGLLVEKDSEADIVSGSTAFSCSKNALIVEAMILQPPIVSFEKLEDESEKGLKPPEKLNCEEFNIPVRSENVNLIISAEPHELPQMSSRISESDVEDHNTDLQSVEQDLKVREDIEKIDSFTNRSKPTNQHEPGGLSKQLSQEGMSKLDELEEEENEVQQIDINAVFDKLMSSDGDYVLQHDVLIQEKLEGKDYQELFADNNDLDAKKDAEETKEENSRDTTLDAPAIVIPGGTISTADFSSVGSFLHEEDRIIQSNSARDEVQTSISSVKLSYNGKYDESVSDSTNSDHSTNYMVRSDSLVNFLPNTLVHDEQESPLDVSTNAELTDDIVWVEENVIIPEPMHNEIPYVSIINNTELSCLEEIMCTSTGILKLSDSCGDARNNSHDPSVNLDEKSAPENINEEEDKTPVSTNDLHVPEVFRYDNSGVVSEFGNRAGVSGRDAQVEPAHQSDPVNVQKKNQNFDKNTKELSHKNHAREENDTLEDELSYDGNLNVQGEHLFTDNSCGRREAEMDPVVVFRRIRSQGHDESACTGSNVPSLPKSGHYFQGSGGNNSVHNPMRNCEVSQILRSKFSQNVPNFSFSGQFSTPVISADYNSGNAMTAAPSFDVNGVSLDNNIALVTVGKTNYFETSKWQQAVPCTAQDDAGSTGLRFFYTHMGPDNKATNEGSESYRSKISNEFYPFIDGASYLFGIPDEIRKEEYFNPCVGAAPSSRGPNPENVRFDSLKLLEGYKRDEPNHFTTNEQNYTMTRRPMQHDLFPIAEGVETKYAERSRSGMKVQVESEHVQMNFPQCRVWNAPHHMLPVDASAPHHNGFDSNVHYSGLENFHTQEVDFEPVEYLQNTVYENDPSAVCSTANGYEFVNPYCEGAFPIVNIPFCLPDHSFVARGQVPPFVFPVGPMNVAQDEEPTVGLEADEQNSLYPLIPHPYWVGFQTEDNCSRAQPDIVVNTEFSSADMNRNHALPQICVNETVVDKEDTTDECTVPDPYFQLAEYSSLHSLKSKVESFNGSLFCESLRSILSSRNTESDNVVPSFSCSSVRCYNPSTVVRSCETSLSNDSLPSVIVEGSYTNVDEDYPAKEKFMNDVNTALNESMMDQIEDLEERPASFLGCGDFEVELVETVDIVPEDIERTLQGIIENSEALEFDNYDYTSHNVGPVEICELEEVEDVEYSNIGSNVNDVLIDILDSVIDNAMQNEGKRTADGVDCDEVDCALKKSDDNDVATLEVSAEVEESIVVQHMIHFEESYVNCEKVARSVDDAEEGIGNGGECGDSSEVVNMFRENEFNDVAIKVDGFGNVGKNDQANWGLKEAGHSARIELEGGSVCEEGEEQVSSNVEISENMRKSRKNRRKKKGAEATKEPESVIAPEIGIGDGSKPREIFQLGKVPVSAIREAHFEQTTGVERTVEEVQAGEGEDQCREDQNGDHEEHDGSLGNSSNYRKRRNRRKKRKN